MKQKKLLQAVVLLVAIGCGLWYSYESNHVKEENLLMLENVEALSYPDYDEDDCMGPAEFSDVGVVCGQKIERRHYQDSIDVERTYDYAYCFAYGNGKCRGTNAYVNWDVSSPSYVKCTGEHLSVDF